MATDLFKPYTLTLSRWHHVADRIRQISESKHREAQHHLGGVSLLHPMAEAQLKSLQARGKRALGLLQEAREALSCVGAIRIALAQANADKGITRLLAEAEAKRRESKMLEAYEAIDLATKVPLAEANKALEKATPSKDAYGRTSPIQASLVSPEALDFISDERRLLEAQVAALQDQVAELNRATLMVELPVKLAKDVGL